MVRRQNGTAKNPQKRCKHFLLSLPALHLSSEAVALRGALPVAKAGRGRRRHRQVRGFRPTNPEPGEWKKLPAWLCQHDLRTENLKPKMRRPIRMKHCVSLTCNKHPHAAEMAPQSMLPLARSQLPKKQHLPYSRSMWETRASGKPTRDHSCSGSENTRHKTSAWPQEFGGPLARSQ